jgi:hypothetical protein
MQSNIQRTSKIWTFRKQIFALIILVSWFSCFLALFKTQQSEYYSSGVEIPDAPPLLTSTRVIPIQERNRTSIVNQTLEEETPHPDHPHAGARFANGSWGYVYDVTLVRKWMLQRYIQEQGSTTANLGNGTEPPLSYLPIAPGKETEIICNTPPKEGGEKKAGWRLLTGKVEVVNSTKLSTTMRSSKLLCAIYTHDKAHARIRGIVETWGWRCDGFFAASTKTVDDPLDEGFGAIDLPHEGKEYYENMWQKTRSIWGYIHDNYLDYEYFFLAGDDTHLIVENLRSYLDNLDIGKDKPLYLGQWIPHPISKGVNGYYLGGGSGYVLNRHAVRLVVETSFPECHVHNRAAAEDRFLSDCFRGIGITGNTSVDATGAQTFHGRKPHDIATDTGHKGFWKAIYQFWGELYGRKSGFDLAAKYSISFHHLKTVETMKRHHTIIYKSCPKGTVLGDILSGMNGPAKSNTSLILRTTH